MIRSWRARTLFPPFRALFTGRKSPHTDLLPHVTGASLQELISDVNHYLRTTEMAENLQRKLLQAKIGEMMLYARQNGVSAEYFRAVNRVFVQKRKEALQVFREEQMYELFNTAVAHYLGRGEQVPQFCHYLAADLVKRPHLPSMTLVNIVRLGAFLKDFRSSFLQAVRLHLEDFVGLLLAEMQKYHELSLDAFETVATYSGSDSVPAAFVQYVEGLFSDQNPKVHEYLDPERNIARVQHISNKVIQREYSAEAFLLLLPLKISMNLVHCTQEDVESITFIIDRLSKADFVLEEDVVEPLLLEALKRGKYRDFVFSLCQKVTSEYSSESRARAEIARCVCEDEDFGLSDVAFSLQTASPKAVRKVVELGVELSLHEYKYLIAYLAPRDSLEAFGTFEKSLSSTNWRDSPDPSVAYTLNRLISALARNKQLSLQTLFLHFTLIRQNHPSFCDADTLRALSERMLAEQCVGDVIELLKRELPKIDKDSVPKIALQESYCAPHKRLFSLLLDFVLTYRQEKTYETNWVLYGELHKYFQVPHETYLPTMRFFCEVNRLNAALLICRRMKMLSELHGNNGNLPPLRDMYLYLFEVFGDNLYEEGVSEVHEYLKMDTLLELDTELQNSVLNAYSNLQDVGKAHDLFLAISANPAENGGVNERTAQIMLKTLTYTDMSHVQDFWHSLSLYGVFPDAAIFKQYLIAHSYHGLVDQAIALSEEAEEYDVAFSKDMLLAMHNYCLEPEKQKEVATWAAERHPGEWEELKKAGLLIAASRYDTDLLLE